MRLMFCGTDRNRNLARCRRYVQPKGLVYCCFGAGRSGCILYYASTIDRKPGNIQKPADNQPGIA